MKHFKVLFWRIAIYLLKRDYGCRCLPEDFEPECYECKAGNVVQWLEWHIEMLKE